MTRPRNYATPAYDALIDLMSKQAIEDGRNMSKAEIHKSARNLMGYVEFMVRIDQNSSQS